jgi:hypothetical protein
MFFIMASESDGGWTQVGHGYEDGAKAEARVLMLAAHGKRVRLIFVP